MPGVISHYLDQLAATRPESEFAIQGERHVNTAEIASSANRLAHALIANDVCPGERIAILSKNSIEYVALFFGVLKAAAVTVPLNFRLAVPEWKFILNDSETVVLFASPEHTEAVDSIRAELPRIRRFVIIGDAAPGGWEAWPELLQGRPDTPPAIHLENNGDALQLYTSGTTGSPKGAVLTHSGWSALTCGIDPLMRVAADERMLLALPMFHIFGAALTFNNARWGSCLYIIDEFDAASVVRALDEQHIGVAPLVPAMIQACLAPAAGASGRKFQDLRLIVYGASPISEATLRRAAEAFRCAFLQLYGMTEFSPISGLTELDHVRALADKPELLLSAGRAAPGIEMRVADPSGEAAAPGVTGEILVRGACMMRGYWKQPLATSETIRDGWMRTGDAGYADDEGYLYIQDRVKDMIVSGGENIYPREVEEALCAMPEIAEVAVIGVPDERWGESVKAFVALRPNAAVTENQVIEFCRTQLAGYKRPRSVDFVEALPRNASGKVLKRELRDRYWKGQARRVGGS
jgi:acyl-CoA synthetase (AMP-forming)/AMP-acid ligase II